MDLLLLDMLAVLKYSTGDIWTFWFNFVDGFGLSLFVPCWNLTFTGNVSCIFLYSRVLLCSSNSSSLVFLEIQGVINQLGNFFS